MPLHNYATEASYSASRTRQAPPTNRELERGEPYRGAVLIPGRTKVDIWMPDAPEGERWDFAFSAEIARKSIDRRRDAEQKLAELHAQQEADRLDRAMEAAYWSEQNRQAEYADWIERQANAAAADEPCCDDEPRGYEPSWER